MSDEHEAVRDEAAGATASAHPEWTSSKVDKIADADESLKRETTPDVLTMSDTSAATRCESRFVIGGNENGLKIKISTALGKSWVDGPNVNGDADSNVGDRAADSSTSGSSPESANEIDKSDVNGLVSQSKTSELSHGDDEEEAEAIAQEPDDKMNSSTAPTDVTLNLNCTSKSGKLLSHWEIMNKCLSKKTLFEAITVAATFPPVYDCPICHFTKTIPQHVLFHMRSHRDLTSVFEIYQNYEQQHPAQKSDQQDVGSLAEVNSASVDDKEGKKKVARVAQESIPILSKPTITGSCESEESDERESDANDDDVSQRPRRRRKRVKEPNAGALSSDESGVDAKPEAVTNGNESDLEGKSYARRRLRKRKPSGPMLFGGDFILDPYDSSQSIDEIFDGMHYEFLNESVSADNPHYCQYCGAKFIRGNGIARHYARHHRRRTSHSRKKRRRRRKKKKPEVVMVETIKNGTASAICQTTLSYKINPTNLSAPSQPEDDSKVVETLQELENNINKVLEYFVKDVEVLISLGWPHRSVCDLLVDILDRCNITPAYRGATNSSKLQCVRQNVSELLSFCIKEDVMESNGWKTQLVDNVILDLIAKVEECSSSDQDS